ncbi:pfs domain-containing protein [Colletotrichum kahawae]|uniref:Pfs domain-containing protein n=1 Tax=Colletotrichum kahawae TaxID=34407 RepID=A0AAD9YKK5_COLKA|nr:pfs domain-containing protein [Colletotrichum kahawae]
MSDPLQYTIGWVCAITTEHVAARAFLDERHEQPRTVAQNDHKAYTSGKIGILNVVIAARPKSEYGTIPAIGVAPDMLESFPNIRLCLMVGIGGGAPSTKHDIRLGDVVVGDRGFFQYEDHKTIRDRTFVQTGSLNQPTTALREALRSLKITY